MKKTLTIIGIIVVVLLVILFLGINTYSEYNVSVNDELNSIDLVKCKWLNKVSDVNIDTSEVGSYYVDVKFSGLLRSGGKTVNVNVYDDLAPTFDDLKRFSVTKDATIDDIKKALNVYDNSKKEVNVNIEGVYDLTKPGMYKGLTINFEDESKNVSSLNTDLIVEIKGGKAKYFTTSNGNFGYEKDGLTFVDGILIVNKTYSIAPDYYDSLSDEFMENFYIMQKDMADLGMDLWIQSGHRLNRFQTWLYNNSCDNYGKELADIKTARPGHSEHEAGLAADFNWVDQSFKYTNQYEWLINNCYKYGFVLRYVEGKEDETGYEFEPWHYRYVGKELAEILYNNGDWLTIEGYFGLESKYED